MRDRQGMNLVIQISKQTLESRFSSSSGIPSAPSEHCLPLQ